MSSKETYCEKHGVNLVQNDFCALCARDAEVPSSKDVVSGPPFTVERYGSFGACVTAERDWLGRELWVVAECIFQNVSSDDAKHWARGIKVSLQSGDAVPRVTVETTAVSCETCLEAHRILSAAGIADGELIEKLEDLVQERDNARSPVEPSGFRKTTFTSPLQQGNLPCDHCGWGVAQHEALTLACPVKATAPPVPACANPVMINSEWYRGCVLPSGHEGDCSAQKSSARPEPGKSMRVVSCAQCADIVSLPISGDRADLSPGVGWYFSTETGWLCPTDAPK